MPADIELATALPLLGYRQLAVSADSRTFSRKATNGTTARVFKNGTLVTSIVAALGLLSYTFATPVLATDQISIVTPDDTKSGDATALPAATPIGTTFDPAGASGTLVLSNSNRTVTSTGSANGVKTLANFNSGKRYIEFTVQNVGTNWQVAIIASTTSLVNGGNGFAGLNDAVTIRWDGAVYKGSGFSNPMNIGALANGDVIGVAVDRTNGVYYVRKNGGTWYGNGGSGKDPAVPAQGDPLPSGLTGAVIHFAAMPGGNGLVAIMNPTPASPPTGYSLLTTAPLIKVLKIAGQSNASGTGLAPNSEDGADAAADFNDPLVFTWDGEKFCNYKPGLRTGFEFGAYDTKGNAGPELGYIQSFRSANPGVPLVIEKFGARGAQLYQSGSNAVYDFNPSSSGELTPQMATMMTAADAALVAAGYTVDPTFFWIQGEADAADTTKASAYQTNLTALVTYVRANCGLGSVGKFIIARVRAAYSFSSAVRTAQFNVAAANTGGPVTLLDEDDLPTVGDNTHLTIPARYTLGNRAYASDMGTYTEPT